MLYSHVLIRRSSTARFAFTLIELLACLAIVTILTSLGVAMAQRSLKAAAKARELNAAKTLTLAYQNAANDNDGNFPKAYDLYAESDIVLPDGRAVSGEPLHRYPYRLAPYYNYQIKGVVLINENAKQINSGDDYRVSLYPALGMNELFIGGRYTETDGQGNPHNKYESECVTNRAKASANIITFVSASGGKNQAGANGRKIDGYYRVQAPNAESRIWSGANWTKEADPAAFGFIDARYDNKAVVAFLDGTVRLMSMKEMDDMQFWSVNAADAGDAEYKITLPRGGRL